MDLPEHLGERCKWHTEDRTPVGEGPVVVWLKSTFRTHENPVIDVGRILSGFHNRELLIYHGVDERYPNASLRHHNMILDAAVDMHDGCNILNLKYVLHVARDGAREPVMKKLSEIASIIVTDMIPLPPWSTWVRTIAESGLLPVVEVDAHCVVPMPLFGKSVERPYQYRNVTKKLRIGRVQREWPNCEVRAEPYLGTLPFIPINIDEEIRKKEDRWNILKKCKIDPTVHPVWHERGGEKTALTRWQDFLEKGIGGYARRRNNAADSKGVSRLSHAFHYGALSPMKVAREASRVNSKSAEKYLDELLIFREHAWHHAASLEYPSSYENLPKWARSSWKETQSDPRHILIEKEDLENSKSPSHLWNLSQTSLRHHGELHNNLRMTWGKAFPLWTKDAEISMSWCLDMNDKYALDGRDPSSIAGVQWCHGLFDRPFNPSVPILGVIRQRDLQAHESRLDMQAYEAHVRRPVIDVQNPIFIIGAGYAGAMAARCLTNHGIEVVVIDKGSKVGGRASARSLEKEHLTHGTAIADAVPAWLNCTLESIFSKEKIKRSGDQLIIDRGPVIIEHLLRDIQVYCETKIVSVESSNDEIVLQSDKGKRWSASGVILTTPLPQSADILGEMAPDGWRDSNYESIWSVLFSNDSVIPRSVIKAAQNAGLVAVCGSDNPSRSLVLHSNSEWSKKHLEKSRSEIVELILDQCRRFADNDALKWLESSNYQGHRWRFARAIRTGTEINIPRIVMAGDAWGKPVGTVGGAISSGAWAAAELVFYLSNFSKRGSDIQSSLLDKW